MSFTNKSTINNVDANFDNIVFTIYVIDRRYESSSDGRLHKYFDFKFEIKINKRSMFDMSSHYYTKIR